MLARRPTHRLKKSPAQLQSKWIKNEKDRQKYLRYSYATSAFEDERLWFYTAFEPLRSSDEH
jgi:hypothetical protein